MDDFAPAPTPTPDPSPVDFHFPSLPYWVAPLAVGAFLLWLMVLSAKERERRKK